MKKKLQSGVDYSTLSDQLLIRSDMKKKLVSRLIVFTVVENVSWITSFQIGILSSMSLSWKLKI